MFDTHSPIIIKNGKATIEAYEPGVNLAIKYTAPVTANIRDAFTTSRAPLVPFFCICFALRVLL